MLMGVGAEELLKRARSRKTRENRKAEKLLEWYAKKGIDAR